MSPAAFLGAQALNNAPALPVVIVGLVYLLVARAGRPYRALGWSFLAVLLVMLSTNSKPYYLAPAFTALYAAGGVALALDALDTGASRNMDNATGINNTYFFLEAYWLGLNGIGQADALRIGTVSWAAGLAFEF
jgi:hypothetical protein